MKKQSLLKLVLLMLLAPLVWAEMEHPSEKEEKKYRHQPTDIKYVYFSGHYEPKHHFFRSLFHHKRRPTCRQPQTYCGISSGDPTETMVGSAHDHYFAVHEFEWTGVISWILNEEPEETVIYIG